jgi:hypothetical protein
MLQPAGAPLRAPAGLFFLVLLYGLPQGHDRLMHIPRQDINRLYTAI